MPGADTDHELFALRQPPALRAFAVAVTVVWAAILVSIALSDDGEAGPLWRRLPAFMLVYGVVMMIRWQRMVVLARPDELMVRNPWRSRTVPRSAIAGFSTGRYQRVGHRTVRADLRDGGYVRLVALDQAFPLPGRERAVEPALDRLEAWRTGGTRAD